MYSAGARLVPAAHHRNLARINRPESISRTRASAEPTLASVSSWLQTLSRHLASEHRGQSYLPCSCRGQTTEFMLVTRQPRLSASAAALAAQGATGSLAVSCAKNTSPQSCTSRPTAISAFNLSIRVSFGMSETVALLDHPEAAGGRRLVVSRLPTPQASDVRGLARANSYI